MDKKDKGQTQATQWSRKTQDKHRQYNGQKRQRTNTGDAMDKKDKGQTEAIQWTIVWPVFVLCLFCPLYGLCLSFVFFVHCMACVCPLYGMCLSFVFFVHCMACVCRLSFFSIVWPVLLRFKVANYPFGIFELFLTKICFYISIDAERGYDSF
jgi:thiol:disulfide interchange protein